MLITQFWLLRLLFFLFLWSPCQPKQLTGYEFPVYTTNMCPRDETEWSQRSSSINCTESNSYICIPNDNLTELLEFCYINPTTWIPKGVCLYLIKRYSRVDSYKCNTFKCGCPDINYKATQLIHYKACVSIGNGCFLADPLCKKEWRDDTTDYEQTTQNIDIDIYRVKDYAIEVLLGTVISILLILFLIIVYVCCKRGKFSKRWKNTDVEIGNLTHLCNPVDTNDEGQ